MVGANVESLQDPWVVDDDLVVSLVTEKSSFGAQILARGIFRDQSDAVNGLVRNTVLNEPFWELGMTVHFTRLCGHVLWRWRFVVGHY